MVLLMTERKRSSVSWGVLPRCSAIRRWSKRLSLDVVSLAPGRPGLPVDQAKPCGTLASSPEGDARAQLAVKGLNDRRFLVTNSDAQGPANVLAVHSGLHQACGEVRRRRPREAGNFPERLDHVLRVLPLLPGDAVLVRAIEVHAGRQQVTDEGELAGSRRVHQMRENIVDIPSGAEGGYTPLFVAEFGNIRGEPPPLSVDGLPNRCCLADAGSFPSGDSVCSTTGA